MRPHASPLKGESQFPLGPLNVFLFISLPGVLGPFLLLQIPRGASCKAQIPCSSEKNTELRRSLPVVCHYAESGVLEGLSNTVSPTFLNVVLLSFVMEEQFIWFTALSQKELMHM